MTSIRTGGNLDLQLLHLQQQGSQPMENQSASITSYENVPIALIFSDNDRGAQAARDAVIAAGGRVGAQARIADASDRLADQVVADAIYIDITHDHGDALDTLLNAVAVWADGDATPAILCAPLEIIDLVAAQMFDNRVTLLCEPDEVDRVSAIATCWSRQGAVLNDISTELDSIRVKRIADEVSRLSRNLSRLVAGSVTPVDGIEASRLEAVRLDFHAEPMASPAGLAIDASEVRAILRLRRLRAAYFSAELFADPAWDMLLDLMAAQLEGEKVAVSSLCIAAAVPATTALRWIKTMCDQNLFERHADPLDGRRIFIGLSPAAANAMTAYIAAAKRIGGLQA